MLSNNDLSNENPSNNLPKDILNSNYSKGLLAGYCVESGEEVYLDNAHLLQHISICGSTGSGTSIVRHSLIKQQMSKGGGLLIIDGGLSDTELEIVNKGAFSCGRISDFILIKPNDPENSNTYSHEINFEECIRQNKIVYVKLPISNADKDAVALAKLIVGDCRSAISRLQQVPVEELPSPPFMFLPNDCASYIDESWSRMFEQGRSSRFIMIPTFQTINSLHSDGDEILSDVVMGNTYYKFFLKQVSMESAIQVAEEIGMKYVAGGDDTYIVGPEKINSIPVGECLLKVSNEKIYHLRLPHTW
jgi:hypothetical protein